MGKAFNLPSCHPGCCSKAQGSFGERRAPLVSAGLLW